MTPPCPTTGAILPERRAVVKRCTRIRDDLRESEHAVDALAPQRQRHKIHQGGEPRQLMRKITSVRSSWGSSGLPLNLSFSANLAVHICPADASGRTVA